MSKKASEKLARFVGKLYQFVEDKKMPDAFKWDSDGKEIEINLQKCDHNKLKQELRIQISSLDTEMRLYDFKKNARASQGGKLVYSNPYFQKGQKELLRFIRRKDRKKGRNTNHLPVNSTMNSSVLPEEEKDESRVPSCEDNRTNEIKHDQEARDQQSSSNAHKKSSQQLFQTSETSQKTLSSMTSAEYFSFNTDSQQLMGPNINTFDSNKEIFPRELISNNSDALDKIRYLSFTDSDRCRLNLEPNFRIRIVPDKVNNTLTVQDTGGRPSIRC